MRRVLIWSGNAVSKVTFMETPHRPLIEHPSLLSAVSIKKSYFISDIDDDLCYFS